jgi:hypothetical protein
MMSVLVTYGNNPLSAVIRHLTKEPASHVAIHWDGWVLHSNLNGVQWSKMCDFQAKAVILDEIPIPQDLAKLLDFSARHVEHGSYDFGGFLYCGIRLALRPIGIKLPKRNLWRMTGMYMCTELVSTYVFGAEDADITPTKLGEKLRTTLTAKT